MLRIGTFALILMTVSLMAAPVPSEKPKEVDPLLGKWKVLEVTVGGVATGKVNEESAAFIDKDKFVFTGIPDEPDYTMAYKRDDAKKRIDMTGNQGKLELPGVYLLAGDVLTIALSLEPKNGPPVIPVSRAVVVFMKLERIKIKAEKK